METLRIGASPFGDMRQRMVAGLLASGKIVLSEGCSYVKKVSKSDQAIKIYSSRSDSILAYKSKGDVEILSLSLTTLKPLEDI